MSKTSETSAKQTYTQPALVELGDLKTDTLTVATTTTGDAGSP